MSKSNEEIAAILLSGYLASGKLTVNAEGAAKKLKQWTAAIEKSKQEDNDSKAGVKTFKGGL
ncbi:hypothetical protein [Lactococcus lactis]|uniref:hypothetical protein n=1 Tax=Lactococcus lactis TaxID=1358 RepID=UPI0024166BF9|nr:hypothetical protein [Lactococcus lactis]MDG4957930.1 hypothetical protein [Lactococcus lactis]